MSKVKLTSEKEISLIFVGGKGEWYFVRFVFPSFCAWPVSLTHNKMCISFCCDSCVQMRPVRHKHKADPFTIELPVFIQTRVCYSGQNNNNNDNNKHSSLLPLSQIK